MPDNNALHIAAKAGNVAEVESQVRIFDINATGEYVLVLHCIGPHEKEKQK